MSVTCHYRCNGVKTRQKKKKQLQVAVGGSRASVLKLPINAQSRRGQIQPSYVRRYLFIYLGEEKKIRPKFLVYIAKQLQNYTPELNNYINTQQHHNTTAELHNWRLLLKSPILNNAFLIKFKH